MIENALTPATRKKEFIADIPEFGTDLPNPNPFVAGTSMRVRQHGQHLSWNLQYRTPTKPIAPLWGEIAESLLSKTLNDVKRFPKSARALANAGAAFLGQGALGKAAEHFAAALNCDPQSCVALGGLARVRILEGDLEAAEELYKRLAAENPSDASALIGLAHVAVSRGQLEDGVSFLESAADSETNRSLAQYHLALLLLRVNRSGQAIGHLRSAVRQEVRWPAMHEALGIAYVLAGSLRKAERSFRTALKLVPNNRRAAHGLAEVLYRLGENNEAIGLLHRTLARDPADLAAREILARAYEKGSAYKRARQQLLEAAPSTDNSSVEQRGRILNNIGVCTSLLEHRQSAAQWFAKSIDSAPTASAVPYLNSARVNIELLHYDSAISALRFCQLQFPDVEKQLAPLLAMCLNERGDEIGAAQELRRAIQKGAGSNLAYSMLGAIIVEGEIADIEGAIGVLEEGYEKYPKDARIGNNLAYAYLLAGLPGRARTVLEKVSPDEDTEVTLTATWGLLRLWEGQLQEGKERYQRSEALAQRKQQGPLAEQVRQKMHLEIARFYLRSGEFEKILPEIRKGLNLKGRKAFRLDLENLRSELDRLS
jgi:tetratricopeptide (TPR) repeat protein